MFFSLHSLAVIISLASSVPLQNTADIEPQHHINSIDVDERPDKQADRQSLVFVQ